MIWIYGVVFAGVLMCYKPFRDFFTTYRNRFNLDHESEEDLVRRRRNALDHILLNPMVKKKYELNIIKSTEGYYLDGHIENDFNNKNVIDDEFEDDEFEDDDLNAPLVGSKYKYFTPEYKFYWYTLASSAVLTYVILILFTKYILEYGSEIGGSLNNYTVEISTVDSGLYYFLGPCIAIFLPFSFLGIILKKLVPHLYLKDLITTSNLYDYSEDIAMECKTSRTIIISICLFFYMTYLAFSFRQNFYLEDKIISKRITWQKTYPIENLYSFKQLNDKSFHLSFSDMGYINALAPKSKYINMNQNTATSFYKFKNKYMIKLIKIMPELEKYKSYNKISKKKEFESISNDPINKFYSILFTNTASFSLVLVILSGIYKFIVYVRNIFS